MADQRRPERAGSASLFAVAFMVGTLCYSLRSFGQYRVSGITAFLIGFVGTFCVPYVRQFASQFLLRNYVADHSSVPLDTLHSEHETKPSERKDETRVQNW